MNAPLAPKALPMRDAFLEALYVAMGKDKKIFLLSADFGSPVIDKIRSHFSERFINVGVAEQNLINISTGLSLEGFTVFAYAIAPFITMRCYEQTRVNLALLSQVRKLNVNLIGVGVGYSYVVSGPTHQCYEDLTIMRAMPTMQVMSPADHVTSVALLETCLTKGGPKYLRFDAQPLPVIYTEAAPDVTQGFHVHRQGKKIAFIATGYMLHTAMKVADTLGAAGHDVGIIDIFNLSNFAGDNFAALLSRYAGIVSLEEGFRGRGGLDSMLSDFMTQRGIYRPFLNIGVKGEYRFDLGSRAELHEKAGIGVDIVTGTVRQFIETRLASASAA